MRWCTNCKFLTCDECFKCLVNRNFTRVPAWWSMCDITKDKGSILWAGFLYNTCRGERDESKERQINPPEEVEVKRKRRRSGSGSSGSNTKGNNKRTKGKDCNWHLHQCQLLAWETTVHCWLTVFAVGTTDVADLYDAVCFSDSFSSHLYLQLVMADEMEAWVEQVMSGAMKNLYCDTSEKILFRFYAISVNTRNFPVNQICNAWPQCPQRKPILECGLRST